MRGVVEPTIRRPGKKAKKFLKSGRVQRPLTQNKALQKMSGLLPIFEAIQKEHPKK